MVRQLLRLWRQYAKMSLLVLLRGRRDAVLQVSTDAVLNLAAVSTSFLLAARFNGIGHWTQSQVFFMLGYFMLVNAILESLFGFNIRRISRRIGRGQLDHLLLQPQPLWRGLVTEGFAPFSQPLVLVIAVAGLVWARSGLDVRMTPSWFALFLIEVVSSATVVLAFQILWGCLAFWAPVSAEEINSSTDRMFAQLGTFPLNTVQPVLTGVLLSAVPVGFSAWYPVRTLITPHPAAWEITATPFAACVFIGLAVVVFRKGIQHYVQHGSQRYSPFGHRR